MKKLLLMAIVQFVLYHAKAQVPVALPFANAPNAAHSLLSYHFFIDSITGPSQIEATAVSITDNGAYTINLGSTAAGVHQLYVTAKNTRGIFSLVNVITFYKEGTGVSFANAPNNTVNLSNYKFYIDSINGPVQVFSTATATTDNNAQTVSLSTTGSGVHQLYVSAENILGQKSLLNVFSFYKEGASAAFANPPAAAADLSAYDFYIDSLTGPVQNIAISTGSTNNSTPSINLGATPSGVHQLYAVAKSVQEKKSIVNVISFYKEGAGSAFANPPAMANPISQVEYYFDTDPGYGNATPLQISPANTLTLQDSILQVPAGLTPGTHHLHVRSKQNPWSLNASKPVLIYVSPFALKPSAINYGSVAIGYNKLDSVTVKNVSTSAVTLNSITMAGPFTSSFTSAVTLQANDSVKIYFTFTPLAQLFYNNTITLNTSTGTETVTLQGSGVPPAPSWTLAPAVGISFGAKQLNSTTTNFFTLHNTGNTPIVVSSDAIQGANVFVDSVYAVALPIGAVTNVRIRFTPTAVSFYNAKLVLKSSTPGLDSIYAVLSGNGIIAGAPPVLQYVSNAPYNGLRGVDPEAGLPGLYTYKVVYKSVNNLPPQVGYPKVGIDRNKDFDFLDLNEGEFTMTKIDTGTNYTAGVTYAYSISYPNYNSLLGYKFIALDQNGNAASTINTSYVNGPVITNQILDLRIFANNISFSASNPDPNQVFTVYATVENSSPFSAANVPLRYYKDSVLIGLDTLAFVPPYGSGTKAKNFSFPVDGYYPIKIWIDSSNTLNDQNQLNNYAIRPIVVGLFSLPGGINATTNVSTTLYCPTRIVISGTAQYYGTSYPVQPMVSGGQVQIIRGVDTFYTNTNVNGIYNYILPTTEGATEVYKVNITDFSLTSANVNNAFTVPANPSTCGGSGGGGGGGSSGDGGGVSSGNNNGSGGSQNCQNVNGNTVNLNLTVGYRTKSNGNPWNVHDKIIKDTLRVYQNGIQVFQQIYADGATRIGNTYNIAVPVTLNTVGNIDFDIVHKYTYNEFFQAPSVTPLYNGVLLPYIDSAKTSIYAAPNLPDLTIGSITRVGLATILTIENKNISCGAASSHVLKVFDSIPNGTYTQVFTATNNFIPGQSMASNNFNFASLAYGYHYFRIVTDVNSQLTETNEANNSLEYVLYYAKPDILIDSVKASNNNLVVGSAVNFRAHIKNVKTNASTFKISFKANGALIGSKKVINSLAYFQTAVIFSDPYIVNSIDAACPTNIEVEVDCDNELAEESETNNIELFKLGSDIRPYVKDTMFGTITKPFIVVKDIFTKVDVPVRNMGTRNVSNVSMSYRLNGTTIGSDVVPLIVADSTQYANSGFYHTFNAIGDYVLQVVADSGNTKCEIDETNNTQPFYINVITGMSDYSVLSQYISPSNLNPNPGQTITFVGTVKNIGNKISEPNVLRFLVDDVQVGADIPINAIYPGLDTTVAASATYSSGTVGIKLVKLVADVNNLEAEHREDNNTATRSIIVGNAPDFARSQLKGITFNPTGFNAGDSVTVNYNIRNYGGDGGTAWLRYIIKDTLGVVSSVDSTLFTIGAIDSAMISKKMKFNSGFGKVITEIVRSNPPEFNVLNNTDSLNFGKLYRLLQPTIINGNLNVKLPNVSNFPGWIGGRLLLGNLNLTVNGKVEGADSLNFIVTNGTGKLKIVNADAIDSFPVGSSANSPNFLVINNMGTPDHYGVNVRDSVYLNGVSGERVTANIVNRTWDITEDVIGGSNATLTFNWKTNHELINFNRNDGSVGHFNGAIWELGPTAAAVSDAPDFWKMGITGVNSFSPFTITNFTGSTLPLELISFNAIKLLQSSQLNWVTAQERNLKHFEIEHSINGLYFDKIGTQLAVNNPALRHTYQFNHNAIARGFNYYRLKMVDLNGTIQYSAILKVINNENLIATVIAPNPVQQVLNIIEPKHIFIQSIILYSTDGNVALQKEINSNVQVYSLPVQHLAAGTYLLKVRYKNETKTYTVIKQ